MSVIRKILTLLLLVAIAAATDTSPITDKLRYEVAVAQRDYLVAKQQFDTAAANLKDRIEQAEKACAAEKASFDAGKLVCRANGSSLQRDTENKQP